MNWDLVEYEDFSKKKSFFHEKIFFKGFLASQASQISRTRVHLKFLKSTASFGSEATLWIWPKTGYPGVKGSWPQTKKCSFCETISCWVPFPTKSVSLNPILKPDFLYLWPLTQKLDIQGSKVPEPRQKNFPSAKPYRVGCPFRLNRGCWIRFWNQFSCIRDPWPKFGYAGVKVSWPQTKKFAFVKPYRVGCLFVPNRGRWIRFKYLFECVNPDPHMCAWEDEHSRSFNFHPLLRRLYSWKTLTSDKTLNPVILLIIFASYEYHMIIIWSSYDHRITA